MAPKVVLFDDAVMPRVLSGMSRLVDTIAPTLGPSGRNVILDSSGGVPTITSSGHLIAEAISVADPLENLGVQLCKEAAAKSDADVGDGTTATILFAHSILEGCMKASPASESTGALIKEVFAAIEGVIDELTSQSEPFSNDVARAIAITAVQDREIGAFVADSFIEVGPDGLVETQPGHSTGFARSLIRGMRFDSGYLSPQFAPSPEANEITFEDPYILVTTARIDSARDLIPVLTQAAESQKPIVIVAADVTGEALSTVIVNAMQKTLKCVCVQAPETGDRQIDFLRDLAAITGAELILPECGAKLSEATVKQLGGAKQVRVNRKSTTILEGRGDSGRIESIATRIESQLKSVRQSADHVLLRKRLAALRGKAVAIPIPGVSETDLKNRQSKVDRALRALRSAFEQGVVAGGGSALLRAGDTLRLKYSEKSGNWGNRIVSRACESITRQLATNTGYESAAVVSRIRGSRNLSFGFNAESRQFEDLLESGIVDPLKVLATSLRNAASIATQIFTVRTAIIDHGSLARNDSVRKSGRRQVHSQYRSLAWPSTGKSSEGVKAFATLLVEGDEAIVADLPYRLDVGLERSSELRVEPSTDKIDFTIAVSAGSARIRPKDMKVISWNPILPSIRETFHLTFGEAGNQVVKVEFYCRRVWLGQINLDLEIQKQAVKRGR